MHHVVYRKTVKNEDEHMLPLVRVPVEENLPQSPGALCCPILALSPALTSASEASFAVRVPLVSGLSSASPSRSDFQAGVSGVGWDHVWLAESFRGRDHLSRHRPDAVSSNRTG